MCSPWEPEANSIPKKEEKTIRWIHQSLLLGRLFTAK